MKTNNRLLLTLNKSILLVLIFTFGTTFTFAQSKVKTKEENVITKRSELPVSSAVDVQVAIIAEKNQVHSSRVGYAGIQTEVYAAFLELQKMASEDELFQLLDHESPAVRVYTFKILERKKSHLLPLAKEKLVNDEEEVMSFSGCIGMVYTVNQMITSGNRL